MATENKTDAKKVARFILEFLEEHNKTISVAESCSSGLLAAVLGDISGASASFKGGIVSYANDVKRNLLGVRDDTLETYGAVSEECAKEMAEGVAHATGSDHGASITGCAAPSGGTDDNPIGTVYVGMYYNGRSKAIKTFIAGDRTTVRSMAAAKALDAMCAEVILGELGGRS